MRRTSYLFIFMVLSIFILTSCTGQDYADLYSSGEYDTLLALCDEDLSSSIDPDALYYKMLCHYRLGQFEEANRSAIVYYAVADKDDDARLDDALRIILYYNDDSLLAVKAGERLCSRPGAGVDEKMSYFKALMATGDYEKAAELYNSIRGELTDRQAALMCIDSKASSTLIVSNLEAWVLADGRSDETRDAVMSAARILLARGEGQLLLSTALNVYQVGDSLLAILIGDIYAQMGIPGTASTYYSYAYEDFPQMTMSRLRALQRRS